jgi:excisionase family DNA binding protein
MARVVKELTVEQAADMLNVPQEYLLKLLEQGKIPFTKSKGETHIQLDDLMEYKEREDAERHQALIDLIRLTEELGLYDKERQE